MFVRATFGPMPVRSKRMSRPAATTERMPETCTASAPKYRMNGRNSSIRMRAGRRLPAEGAQRFEHHVGHHAHARCRRMRRRSRTPRNPHGRFAHFGYAADGRRDGELEADDAGRVVEQRFALQHARLPLRQRRLLAERRHRDRVRRPERRLPSANAAASGIAGHTACSAKPTATIVAIARPIANDSDSFTDLSSSDLSISCASKYSSGAMNSTMNSSGLSVTSGKERQLRRQRAQRDLHERRGDLGYEAT